MTNLLGEEAPDWRRIMTMANDNDTKEGEDTPPWLQSVGEDEEVGKGGYAVRVFLIALAVGVVALFGSFIWMMYSGADEGTTPVVVKAPGEPYKVEPEDRGGMEVPHQDKLVFDQVSGATSQVEEALRAEAEEPVARPEAQTMEAADAVAAAPDSAPDGTAAESDAQQERTGTASAEEPSAEPSPAAERAQTHSDAVSDEWQVQIAALRSERNARAWAQKVKNEHDDVFADLRWAIQKTAREFDTPYFRIRFGPLASREAALAKCGEVQAAGLNCLIVKPGT